MKAPDFQYQCPLTLEDALQQLSSEGTECQPLAGGQSLMPMMHLRMAYPEVLLDLNRLPELDFIEETDTHIEIGAMVRYSSLLNSELIRKCVPLFTQAIPHIAHEAIRHRGTIGGSVALADPAAEMPALLKALNANIVVVSKSGMRSISADEFFLGIYETALRADELVHTIQVPVARSDQKFGFYELARRHGDYAMAGVALSTKSVEPYSDLRIVFFSVSDHAVRAIDAENELNGKSYDDITALNRSLDALSLLNYYEDLNATSATKTHLARVVMKRALERMSKVAT